MLSSAVRFAEAHRWRLSASITERFPGNWYWTDWALAANGVERPCPVRSDITPLPNEGRVEVLQAEPCGRSAGNGDRARRLFVVGNSHALAYGSLFMRLAATQPFVVRVYFRSGCTFLKLDAVLKSEPPNCREFFDAVMKDLGTRARDGDVLFLPSLRLPRLSDQWGRAPEAIAREALFGPNATTSRNAAREEAVRVLQPFLRAGVRVVFEAPKPLFRAPSFRCSDWFNKHNPVCAPGLVVPRDFMLAYRQPILDAMRSLSRMESSISVWDPFDVLCPGLQCEAVSDGKPLFVDSDHVSSHANELLYPSFLSHLHLLETRFASAQPSQPPITTSTDGSIASALVPARPPPR